MERPALNHFQISLDNGEERGAWAKKVRQWLADPPLPMTGHPDEDNQGSVEGGLPCTAGIPVTVIGTSNNLGEPG